MIRERVKKEQEIVLSPQRRSFNTGCLMPTRKPFESVKTYETPKTFEHTNSKQLER